MNILADHSKGNCILHSWTNPRYVGISEEFDATSLIYEDRCSWLYDFLRPRYSEPTDSDLIQTIKEKYACNVSEIVAFVIGQEIDKHSKMPIRFLRFLHK